MMRFWQKVFGIKSRGSQPQAARARRQQMRLQVEALEDRMVPAFLDIGVSGGTSAN
jgi:hypothetical protein